MPALDVYRRLGFELIQEIDGVTRWQLVISEKQIAIPEWIAVRLAAEGQYA